MGLGGEIRAVNQAEKRIQETQKLGFKKIIMPDIAITIKSSCEIIKLNNVKEALEKI